MKKNPLINILFVWALIVSTFGISEKVSAKTSTQLQSGTLVTATGKFSDDKISFYLSMTFKFNPAGGPVSGSTQGSGTLNIAGITSPYTAKGTLTGNFEGGDGGKISGDIQNAITTPDGKTQNDYGTWEGILNADGTGGGQMANKQTGAFWGTWSVTFSADEFLAALATPTSFAVVGQKIQLTAKAREFITNSPTLDEATKAVLNQDSVLIVRDDNNQFFAINNLKKAVPLPASLGSTFQLNDAFSVLGNNDLLNKAGHGDLRDDINGGSQAGSLDKIPGELKNRDYMGLTTQCSHKPQTDLGSYHAVIIRKPVRQGDLPEVCEDLLRVNTPDTSFHNLPDWAYHNEYFVGSSEHSSIRGSINGGGDFIYYPFPANGMELASLSYLPRSIRQNAGNQPYLGVQVEDGSSGAIIKMVQKTSPAEQAGLAIGDTVTSVSGTPVDSQNTLAALIGQHAGGDQVKLGIIRNGAPQSVPVTLAEFLPPMIVTPSAEITVNDQTDIVVDIGFNGVTGVLVLADSAHVREPVTGSEVDVPAGSAVIVVPGDKIGAPIPVSDSDIHAWWKNPGTTPATPESLTPTPGPNPSPDGSTLLVLVIGAGCLCVVVIVLIVVIVLVTRKKKQPPAAPPPYYPPQR